MNTLCYTIIFLFDIFNRMLGEKFNDSLEGQARLVLDK